MGQYVLRRSLGALLTLFFIVTVSFFMIRAAPGGPFSKERSFPPEVLRNIEKKYDLDKPLLVQYGIYLKRVIFQWDLGPSTRYADRSVNELIGPAFKFSVYIGLGAFLTAILVGITAGLIAALNHNKKLDYIPMGFAMVGVSMPDFVLATLLVIVFGITFQWLPAAGVGSMAHYVMPWITLGLVYAASIARLTRGGMLEILGQDFIRTAYAKGLSKKTVVVRHSLKGGLLPAISYLGPATAGMLTGSLIVESIFFIPGMGKLLIESAINRDYTLALGCVIVFALMILILNFIVDLLYAFLDPRVSYA